MRFAQCLQGSRNTGDTAPFRGLTVVGYANNPLENGGKKMSCANFLDIGTEGTYLSKIQITGYQNCQEFQDNDLYGFSIKILSASGGTLATYFWKDYYDTNVAGDWDGGKWYHSQTEKFIGDPGEPDYLLQPGDSVWAESPSLFPGSSGYKFLVNGSVVQLSRAIPMTAGGKKAIGNLFAVDILLSKISITGYQGCQEFQDNDLYGFSVKVLNAGGGTAATYFWKDYFDTNVPGDWDGGAWYHSQTEKFIGQSGEPDYLLKSGDGLWCEAASLFPGAAKSGYTMVFPGLDLE